MILCRIQVLFPNHKTQGMTDTYTHTLMLFWCSCQCDPINLCPPNTFLGTITYLLPGGTFELDNFPSPRWDMLVAWRLLFPVSRSCEWFVPCGSCVAFARCRCFENSTSCAWSRHVTLSYLSMTNNNIINLLITTIAAKTTTRLQRNKLWPMFLRLYGFLSAAKGDCLGSCFAVVDPDDHGCAVGMRLGKHQCHPRK